MPDPFLPPRPLPLPPPPPPPRSLDDKYGQAPPLPAPATAAAVAAAASVLGRRVRPRAAAPGRGSRVDLRVALAFVAARKPPAAHIARERFLSGVGPLVVSGGGVVSQFITLSVHLRA